MTSSTCTVTLHYNGHELRNDGDVEEILGALLMPDIDCRTHCGQVNVYRSAKPLLRDHGVAMPARGLLEVLRALAREYGHEFYVYGTRLNRLTTGPDTATPENPAVVQLMLNHETGLIRYGGGIFPNQIALDIARAFPTNTIYFLSSKFDRVRNLAKYLANAGQPCELLGRGLTYLPLPDDDADDDAEAPPMIVASTFGGVNPYHYTHADAAVLLDAAEVTHQRARAVIADPDQLHVRLFGLLHAERPLSPREQTQIFAAFGNRQVEIRPHGRQQRQIELALVDYRRRDPELSRRKHPTINQLYGANRGRNAVIRRVANAIYRGELPAGRHYRELVGALSGRSSAGELRIAVMTETLPHAVRLARQLRGWPLVCASELTPGVLERMSPANRELLNERCDRERMPLGRRAICTASGAANTTWFIPDVVVWAGGAAGASALPMAWTECSQRELTRLLLVDLQDGFHRQAAAFSRQRQHGLRSEGIYRVGAVPVIERWRDFVRLQLYAQEQSQCR